MDDEDASGGGTVVEAVPDDDEDDDDSSGWAGDTCDDILSQKFGTGLAVLVSFTVGGEYQGISDVG